ncbi:hypothetical protein JQ582_26025 [Bradyrhizobium japonicum]|uniref:hypothetical protein n=1 Tax=Bradyrhizobium japonicum TaxID=375 RepID=UPI001BA549E7|nr:hypothetical protein [Bradyrhizobium japonicum]MBR0747398.1 hypothetical protein [Bradyrhizobium japonicum]
MNALIRGPRLNTGYSMADTSSTSFAPKDLVVMVPAVGSALALCWEVGSFLPVGGAAFSYFSITEHIAFAVPALPFAILVASAGYAGFLTRGRGPRAKHANWPYLLLVFIFASAAAYVSRTALFAVVAFAAVLIGMVELVAARESRRTAKMVAGLMILLALAVAQGVDFTRGRLNKEELAEIAVADGTVRAVVFRAGERGVLLYNRPAHRFQFLRWDAVHRVDWDRAPIKPDRAFGTMNLRD